MLQEKFADDISKHKKIRDRDIMRNRTAKLDKFKRIGDLKLNEQHVETWVTLLCKCFLEVENMEKWKLFIVEFAVQFNIYLDEI
jgi:hypothetical protein